jgi:hypothetical protein
MLASVVTVTVGCQGGREVDAECGFGADERVVEMVEGVGKDRDRIAVSEAGQGVAAPARKVHLIECDVRPFATHWLIG